MDEGTVRLALRLRGFFRQDNEEIAYILGMKAEDIERLEARKAANDAQLAQIDEIIRKHEKETEI